MEGNRSVTYSLLIQLLLAQPAFSTGSLINTGMLFMMNSGSTFVSLHTPSYKKITKSHQMFWKAAPDKTVHFGDTNTSRRGSGTKKLGSIIFLNMGKVILNAGLKSVSSKPLQ